MPNNYRIQTHVISDELTLPKNYTLIVLYQFCKVFFVVLCQE